jgi:N-acyl-D-amino-acid deacylase
MQRMLETALADGAIGLSTGPGYAPMGHAGPDELIGLARQAGFVAIHQRDYRGDLLRCTAQTVALAETSGVRWQLSHLQASGEAAEGLGREAVRILDDARRRGVDIACDMYPYTAGSTVLQAILPDWATDGGAEATLRRLKDPTSATQIVADLEALDRYWPSMVLISAETARNKPYVGRTFPEIAEARSESVAKMVCSILLEEALRACYVVHHMKEPDLECILSWPHTMIGSDGLHLRGAAHPRLAGTFARWIGPFVRDRRLVGLPEAVRRITSLPADRLGLRDRGRIAPGCWADLVLFDPLTVADAATFGDPNLGPYGMPFVWVNGQAVKRPDGVRRRQSGKVLRWGAPKSEP